MEELRDIGREIGHESETVGMVLGHGDSDAKHLDAYAGSGREARQDATAGGRHVALALVVIPYGQVEIAAGYVIDAKDQMAEKVGSKVVLDFELSGIVDRLKGQMPTGQVLRRERKAERGMPESLGKAELYVPGHGDILGIVSLQLSTEVFHHQGE